MFGLPGKAIEWCRSCLEQSSQKVSVRGILSTVQSLLYGVLQSSILAPLGPMRSDMALNITCMLITHSCIYHWNLIIN